MPNEAPHNYDRNAPTNRPMVAGGIVPAQFGGNLQPSDPATDYAVREELF